MIVVVRPWKLPSATMIFARSAAHALHAVAPGAGDLDARLDGLGARVHRQHHVFAGERGERRRERPELVVVERAARERDAVELGLGRRDERRMPVAEVDGRVRGEAVEVAAALDVGDPGALGRRDDDRERVVVVRERASSTAMRVGGRAGGGRDVGRVVIGAAPGCST